MSNLANWQRLSQPPQWALRQIQAGRLKGKSDINPQWRYQAMTEVYGECGSGWCYDIEKLWTEAGTEGQVFAFAKVNLYTKCESGWSAAIPGIGGHMLLVKEKSGIHNNDEAYKMAVTDALSTAMKMLGVAADIYAGAWDGSKYAQVGPATKPEPKPMDKELIASAVAQISTTDELTKKYKQLEGEINSAANKQEIVQLFADRKKELQFANHKEAANA